MLAKVVKPDGIVVVELADSIFIKGNQYTEPISSLIQRYFESVSSVEIKDAIDCDLVGCFLLAKDPRVLHKIQVHI